MKEGTTVIPRKPMLNVLTRRVKLCTCAPDQPTQPLAQDSLTRYNQLARDCTAGFEYRTCLNSKFRAILIVPAGTLKVASLGAHQKAGASVRGFSTMGEKDPSTEVMLTLHEFGVPSAWFRREYVSR